MTRLYETTVAVVKEQVEGVHTDEQDVPYLLDLECVQDARPFVEDDGTLAERAVVSFAQGGSVEIGTSYRAFAAAWKAYREATARVTLYPRN